MKDDFLKRFRKKPRREFTEALYQRLNEPKARTAALPRRSMVWGLVSVALALSMALNLQNYLNLPVTASPEPELASANEGHLPTSNPILMAGEHGLTSASFNPPQAEREWLSPMDYEQSHKLTEYRIVEVMSVFTPPAQPQ